MVFFDLVNDFGIKIVFLTTDMYIYVYTVYIYIYINEQTKQTETDRNYVLSNFLFSYSIIFILHSFMYVNTGHDAE